MPYSALPGTGSSPRGSRSRRVALIGSVRSVTAPSVANQESPIADQFYSTGPETPSRRLLGGLHPQGVVEAIEGLRHPDHERDLHDLPRVPRGGKPGVQLVPDVVAGAMQHVGVLERRPPARVEPLQRGAIAALL